MEADKEKSGKVSEKYFEILKGVLKDDLSKDNFNCLTEMMNYCPQKMHDLVEIWIEKVCFNSIQKVLNIGKRQPKR